MDGAEGKIHCGFIKRRVPLVVLTATLGAEWLRLFDHQPEPCPWFPSSLRTSLAFAAALLVGMAVRSPFQNCATLLAVAFVASRIPVTWGAIPEGIVSGGLAWFSWWMMARGVARAILLARVARSHFGLWLLVTGSALAAVWCGFLDPVASRLGWQPRAAGTAALVMRSVGRFTVFALGSAVATPWLIDKRPGSSRVDRTPLVVFLLASSWLVACLAAAGRSGLAVVWGGIGGFAWIASMRRSSPSD